MERLNDILLERLTTRGIEPSIIIILFLKIWDKAQNHPANDCGTR